MDHFIFRWDIPEEKRHITWRWLLRTFIWAILAAYIPNIIWYLIGPHRDAVIVQCIIMAVGMPAIILLSLWSYRKQDTVQQWTAMFMRSRIRLYGNVVSDSYDTYATEWNLEIPDITSVTISEDKVAVKGNWHIEAFELKKGSPGKCVASEYAEKEVEIPHNVNKEEIRKFIRVHYGRD